jgi:MOSC domain-containing protein YiiM
MTGRIIQIGASRGGIPKRAVPEAIVTPLGLEGDACANPRIHGGPRQALLILTSEGIEELIARGYPLFYGALGENLTTRGLDRRQFRVGQQLRAGAARIEITKIRGPCSTLDIYGPAIKHEIYDKRVRAGDPASPRWGLSGFYASIIECGSIRVNDEIALEAVLV